MRLSYHPDTDSLYVEFNDRPGVDSVEVASGLVIDLDETGKVVGIDIDHASKFLDLKTLEASNLPIPAA
jgi:uncharacterized protein YuzE